MKAADREFVGTMSLLRVRIAQYIYIEREIDRKREVTAILLIFSDMCTG
jgi:hypothetical protein